MRKMLFLTFIALFGATPAHAIQRHNVDRMSCGAAQGILAREGAAILRYKAPSGSGMTLYDRFVRHGGFCEGGKRAKLTTIPVADTPDCPVLHCVDLNYDNQFWTD